MIRIIFIECVSLKFDECFSSVPVMKEISGIRGVRVDYFWVASLESLTLIIHREVEGVFEGILYLSFHGSAGAIDVNGRSVSLQKLSYRLRNRLHGFDVFFSSCETLWINQKNIADFLERTGANSISGYKRPIETELVARAEVKLLFEILKEKRHRSIS